MTLLLLIGGFVCLLVGGEALLRGAVALGQRMKLSPLVVGLIIVGVGTSMPELIVCVEATYIGKPALAAGNVFGSNTSNILLILGAACLIKPIRRPDRLMRQDSHILPLVTVGIVLLGLQGLIPAWQGVIMLLLLAAIVAMEFRQARANPEAGQIDASMALPDGVPKHWSISVLFALVGLGALLLGAELLIEGASRAARSLGVPEQIIGLTVLAIGTSLPELASAIIASTRGHPEVAYGNVVGSNLFNSLGILGASTLAGPLTVPRDLAIIDGTVMIAATVAMILFMWSGRGLSRREGVVLLLVYAAYVTLRLSGPQFA